MARRGKIESDTHASARTWGFPYIHMCVYRARGTRNCDATFSATRPRCIKQLNPLRSNVYVYMYVPVYAYTYRVGASSNALKYWLFLLYVSAAASKLRCNFDGVIKLLGRSEFVLVGYFVRCKGRSFRIYTIAVKALVASRKMDFLLFDPENILVIYVYGILRLLLKEYYKRANKPIITNLRG